MPDAPAPTRTGAPAGDGAPAVPPAGTAGDPDRVPWPVAAVAAAAVAVGLVLRFVAGSPLWLDEALSVDIAALPPADLLDALARDGHPPLYYLVLHAWMGLVGTDDAAVRSLSGALAVVALVPAWAVGRRLGGRRLGALAVAVLALSPFALRYATETRMYALVSLLVLVGWLLLDDVLSARPGGWRPVLLAAVSGALLLTHYWALFLLAVVGALVLARAWRAGAGPERRAALVAAASLALGGLAFLPWLPTFLEQAAHTGTPWGSPLRPTEVLGVTVQDLAGGGLRDAVAGAGVLSVLAVLGVAGRPLDDRRIEVDLRTRPPGRALGAVAVGTLLLGSLVGVATGATYASRYAAVVLPVVVVLVALGIATIRQVWAQAGVLALVCAFGLLGAADQLVGDRSQAGVAAAATREALAEVGGAGVVVYCPDQLAPAYDRALAGPPTLDDGGQAGSGTTAVRIVYPTFEVRGGDGPLPPGAERVDGPVLVDWYDYEARNAAATPSAFATDVLAVADGAAIALVWAPGYATLDGQCEELRDALAAARPGPQDLVRADTGQYVEAATVTWFPPVAP